MKIWMSTCLLLCCALGCAHAQTERGLSPPLPGSSDSNAAPEVSLRTVMERLKLTPAQQAYWSNYVARLDDYSKLYYQERPASAFALETAPRQIGRAVDRLQNRLAVLEEIEGVAKALYAALDPAQQQVADQLLPSTVPTFAPPPNPVCPPIPVHSDKAESGQHKRRGGAPGF